MLCQQFKVVIRNCQHFGIYLCLVFVEENSVSSYGAAVNESSVILVCR